MNLEWVHRWIKCAIKQRKNEPPTSIHAIVVSRSHRSTEFISSNSNIAGIAHERVAAFAEAFEKSPIRQRWILKSQNRTEPNRTDHDDYRGYLCRGLRDFEGEWKIQQGNTTIFHRYSRMEKSKRMNGRNVMMDGWIWSAVHTYGMNVHVLHKRIHQRRIRLYSSGNNFGIKSYTKALTPILQVGVRIRVMPNSNVVLFYSLYE